MARTELSVTNVPSGWATSGVAGNFQAADTSNGNKFPATGQEILLAHNTDTSSHTVDVTSTGTGDTGRTGDISSDSIAAGEIRVYQEFPTDGWKQSDGTIYVDADATSVEFCVLRTRG